MQKNKNSPYICTPIQERCSSGLRGTPGKRVYDKIVSRVRIPQRKKRLHSFGMRLFFAPSASSSLAKPEAWKSHDMLRISAVLSQPFLLVARAPRRALRECAALQGEHNPDEGAWRVLRLQARLQSRRRGMRRKNGNLSYYFPPHSHLASFGIIDNQ